MELNLDKAHGYKTRKGAKEAVKRLQIPEDMMWTLITREDGHVVIVVLPRRDQLQEGIALAWTGKVYSLSR